MDHLAEALHDVRDRIAGAARRAGRAPDSVTLLGATKAVPAERIAAALGFGLVDVGENRAQELLAKAPVLAAEATPPRWHFVGRLQRNKVAALVPWVSVWQSVDREPLVAALARRAPGATTLIEVNVGDEPQKDGCAAVDAPALVDTARALGLEVTGLMTVHPQRGDPRRWFTALRDLGERLELTELSMGMSDDFEIAVEEGATMVRVGRLLFGER